MTGVVYFVAAPGRIKIGYSSQPKKRLRALQTLDLEELTVIAMIPGNRAIEASLHNMLWEHRLKGEWFRDCDAVWEVMSEAVANPPPVAEEPPAVRFDWEKCRDEVHLIIAPYLSAEFRTVLEDVSPYVGKPLPKEWHDGARIANAAILILAEIKRHQKNDDPEEAMDAVRILRGFVSTFKRVN